MADDPRKQDETTPKGAVEVNESDLDQAAGGVSLNYSKIVFDTSTQRIAPTTDISGPHVAPEKI